MPFDSTRFHDHSPPDRSLGARGIRNLLARLSRWRQLARQRAELARLDDRLLRDIGISQEDAAAEARRPFWEDPADHQRALGPALGYRFVGILARLQGRSPSIR